MYVIYIFLHVRYLAYQKSHVDLTDCCLPQVCRKTTHFVSYIHAFLYATGVHFMSNSVLQIKGFRLRGWLAQGFTI